MTTTITLVTRESCCSHCGKEVLLNEEERVAGRFTCPGCRRSSAATLGSSARCAGCNKQLALDARERELGRFSCPYCKVVSALPGAATAPEVVPVPVPEPTQNARGKGPQVFGVMSMIFGGMVGVSGLTNAGPFRVTSRGDTSSMDLPDMRP